MQPGDNRIDQDPDFCGIGDLICAFVQKRRSSEPSSYGGSLSLGTIKTKGESELINEQPVSSLPETADNGTNIRILSLEMASSLAKLFAFIDEQTVSSLPDTTESGTDVLPMEMPSSLGELFSAIDGWMTPIDIVESTSNTDHFADCFVISEDEAEPDAATANLSAAVKAKQRRQYGAP